MASFDQLSRQSGAAFIALHQDKIPDQYWEWHWERWRHWHEYLERREEKKQLKKNARAMALAEREAQGDEKFLDEVRARIESKRGDRHEQICLEDEWIVTATAPGSPTFAVSHFLGPVFCQIEHVLMTHYVGTFYNKQNQLVIAR